MHVQPYLLRRFEIGVVQNRENQNLENLKLALFNLNMI